MLTLICGVIFLYVSDSYKHSSQDKANHFSFRKKNDLTIRGFRFSGYHEGRKTLSKRRKSVFSNLRHCVLPGSAALQLIFM